jgi:uncharacterized protein YndB with AHSA1/START domain
VQRVIAADTPAPPAKLFEVMSDLATYQEWMELIERCEPAVAAEGDRGPAWWVTLRAKVGPFARSKRLRMVRVAANEFSSIRFERHENDGRKHSDWVMTADIQPIPAGSHVSVQLSYSGGLWSGPLDAVLGSQVDSAVPRLREYVSA